MTEPLLLALERLILPRPVTAGMNPLKLMAMAYEFRATTEDREPIHVTCVDGTDLYRITDGRHRFVASLIAGRPAVLSHIIKP